MAGPKKREKKDDKKPSNKPAQQPPAKKPAATAPAVSPTDWPAPPKVKDGEIHLFAFSAFAVENASKPGAWVRTWGNNDKNRKPVQGAKVFVVGQGTGNVSPGVDVHGNTTLGLNGLPDGSYTLRLVPTAKMLTTEKAGPALVPSVGQDIAYRQLDVTFTWAKKRIAKTPAPTATDPNGRVVVFTSQSMTIDWKPDWVRAKQAGKRSKEKVNAVVLHRTGEKTIGTTLENFVSQVVNAHYVIDTDGFIVKMVHDTERANHAGTGAQWNLLKDNQDAFPVNDFSIGIEHVNAEGTAFTEKQMTSLEKLLKELMAKHNIDKRRVLSHCEVSPLEMKGKLCVNNRINCPGKEFDWPRLEGKGLAKPPFPTRLPPLRIFRTLPGITVKLDDDDAKGVYGGQPNSAFHGTIAALQRDLANVGYDKVPNPTDRKWLTGAGQTVFLTTGKYDKVMAQVVFRFQRRYLSDMRRVDGNVVKFTEGEVDKLTSEMIIRVVSGRGLP